MHYVNEGPHKHGSINMCVYVCVSMSGLLSSKSVVLTF